MDLVWKANELYKQMDNHDRDDSVAIAISDKRLEI